MTLASSLTDFHIDWIDAVHPNDLWDKSHPQVSEHEEFDT
jgi:hypothetical protein